jgi:C4-dicarboxylate transporter/malic acid transport protein
VTTAFRSGALRETTFFEDVGPNWFASVMGTGIVATAAALLPRQTPVLHTFALVVWAIAAALLGLLAVATLLHWLLYPANARRHLLDPAMAPFYGAPAMALLTVGSGALLVAPDVLGERIAVHVDLVLWLLGTVLGLLAAATVPFVMFTRQRLRLDSTHATWLMPVVPPMVSAAAAAGLVPHLPSGQVRLTCLLAAYALFGLSLLASVITITLVWARLAYHELPPPHVVPSLWIVLGPLGQSVTAASLLGGVAGTALPRLDARVFDAVGLLYGTAVWGFAMLWLAIAAAATVRTLRDRLPFSLTWWSFTFPLGTVVTGTSVLATRTGLEALAWIAIGLYAGLLAAWATVTIRTTHALLVRGTVAPAGVGDVHRAGHTSFSIAAAAGAGIGPRETSFDDIYETASIVFSGGGKEES